MSEEWWDLRNEIEKGLIEAEKGIQWMRDQCEFCLQVMRKEKTWDEWK